MIENQNVKKEGDKTWRKKWFVCLIVCLFDLFVCLFDLVVCWYICLFVCCFLFCLFVLFVYYFVCFDCKCLFIFGCFYCWLFFFCYFFQFAEQKQNRNESEAELKWMAGEVVHPPPLKVMRKPCFLFYFILFYLIF